MKASHEQIDELFILYPNAMVTIDGFSLYQSLRACRNQLAKAHASSMNENVDPPPLAYQKYRITEHEKINDATNVGIHSPCFFDRMQTASFLSGVKASVKGSSPAFHHFIATGKTPFVSVYQALEGGSPPMISEVAMAVASKLTSAVLSRITAARGWFGGSDNSTQQVPSGENKPKVELGSILNSRYCLQDKHREAERVVVAPIGHLAVVTDAFNRVLLFDVSKGIVIRMWKGYRDAECGWVVVEEEQDEGEKNLQSRRALFLTIYAPKRGILSIYLTEHGARVGAFNVGKDCRLLYQGYGSLGCTHRTREGNYNKKNQCFLLQADGTIKSIHIPFHCALSSLHSTRAKDLHLLKKVTAMIDKSVHLEKKEEMFTTLGKVLIGIQVTSTQRKAIDTLLASPVVTAEFMKKCLKNLIKSLEKNGDSVAEEVEDLEYHAEKQELLSYCVTQHQLIETFMSIKNLPPIKEEIENIEEDHNLSSLLHITTSEAESLLNSINNYKEVCLNSTAQKNTKKIKLEEVNDMSISMFISCFNVYSNEKNEDENILSTSSKVSTKNMKVEMKETLTKEIIHDLGTFLFEGALKGDVAVSQLTLILESSKLPPKQLMVLLSTFTQTETCNNILDLPIIQHLHSVVASLGSIRGGAEAENVDQLVGQVSKWWQEVRNILSQSVLIAQSLIMAFVCRSVSMEINAAAQKVKTPDESEISNDGWEAVTMDMEHWNFLITQLEQLLELDAFVHTTHETQQLSGMDNPTFQQHLHSGKKSKRCKVEDIEDKTFSAHQISRAKTISRMPTFSVAGVIDAGYGAFAYIVADCLVRQGVPGPCLGKLKPKLSSRERACSSNLEEEGYDDDIPNEDQHNQHDVLASLCRIREIFPYSVGEDILWAHCAWECIMVWNEDVEDTSMLSSGLIHLSCIHDSILQQGLAVMMWRAVFKESIKSLHSLVDKVGKAPKDRLCRKNLSLSFNALEDFLSSAKQLLEILVEIDAPEDNQFILKTEELWVRKNSSQRSIVEQAIDQAFCDKDLIAHNWLLVVALYLLMHGNVRSIKPSMLFDTKGRHALSQPLHAMPHLSNEIDDKIMRYREQFCINVSDNIIKNHMAINTDENEAKSNTSQLLDHLSLTLILSEKFKVDYDRIRRVICCMLYRVGLDVAAQEMAMCIEDGETFVSQMLEVIRNRLASNLLCSDMIADSISKLPTKISSWLQHKELNDKDENMLSSTFQIPLSNTFHLLQNLHSSHSNNNKNYKFLNELIDSLKIFL